MFLICLTELLDVGKVIKIFHVLTKGVNSRLANYTI